METKHTEAELLEAVERVQQAAIEVVARLARTLAELGDEIREVRHEIDCRTAQEAMMPGARVTRDHLEALERLRNSGRTGELLLGSVRDWQANPDATVRTSGPLSPGVAGQLAADVALYGCAFVKDGQRVDPTTVRMMADHYEADGAQVEPQAFVKVDPSLVEDAPDLRGWLAEHTREAIRLGFLRSNETTEADPAEARLPDPADVPVQPKVVVTDKATRLDVELALDDVALEHAAEQARQDAADARRTQPFFTMPEDHWGGA